MTIHTEDLWRCYAMFTMVYIHGISLYQFKNTTKKMEWNAHWELYE